MMQEIKEFRVNDYITLKLENNKTNIYIKGELFQQCKYLLINIPVEQVSSFDKVDSIDDAAEMLDETLHEREPYIFKISPEAEFWAHSSNLQVWCEHKYDTRLLHSSLVFALLKKLYEKGDPLAKKKFKEEIVKRFIPGNLKIQQFLKMEGYLDILSKEELLSEVSDSDIVFKLEQSLGQKLKINTPDYPNPKGIVIENAVITWLSLDNCGLIKVPEIMKELKSLKGLVLERNSLVSLPDWIGNFRELEYLDVSENQLESIPESIGYLKKLIKLELDHNKLRKIPESIGNLTKLEIFFLNENGIKELPESIGNLSMLKDLVLSTNLLEILPESIGNLSMLTSLAISSNLLKSLPESIGQLSSLWFLNMGENPIQKLPRSINDLQNLRTISLEGIDEDKWNLTNYKKKILKIYK